MSGISMASSVTITNSILSNSISDNFAVAYLVHVQPALMANGSANIAAATMDLTQPNIVVAISSNGGVVVGSPLNVDPQLGPLANNSGPTSTMTPPRDCSRSKVSVKPGPAHPFAAQRDKWVTDGYSLMCMIRIDVVTNP